MKNWEKIEFNSLDLEFTQSDTNPLDFPHYWMCLTCGKHHVGTIIGEQMVPPAICGHNGCTGTEFKDTCGPEIIIS